MDYPTFKIMKGRGSSFAKLLCALALMLAAIGLRVTAQTEPELGIQTYAGLTITGEVGTVYSIEYMTDPAEPTETDWRCLEFLQLPASPYLWADKSTPAMGSGSTGRR